MTSSGARKSCHSRDFIWRSDSNACLHVKERVFSSLPLKGGGSGVRLTPSRRALLADLPLQGEVRGECASIPCNPGPGGKVILSIVPEH
jgi:hypothetical protein